MHVCPAGKSNEKIPTRIKRLPNCIDTVILWYTDDMFTDDVVAWVTVHNGTIYEFQAPDCGEAVITDVETWAHAQLLDTISMKIQICRDDAGLMTRRNVDMLNLLMVHHDYRITDLCHLGDGMSVTEFVLTKELK